MAAPKTVATYDLDGSTREFDFAFDYLSRAFVQVTLIGESRETLPLNTGFTFISSNRLRLSEAYGPPEWNFVEIRRVTSATERLVEFQDASILRADDLDLSSLQVLHIAEEAREAATETLGTNEDGELDARGRRIVNLGEGIQDSDAMTMGQYRGDVTGTYVNRVAAEQARDKAREWASKETTVEGSLQSAKTYATQALSSSSTATTKAQEAALSASNALVSASDAEQSRLGVLNIMADALAHEETTAGYMERAQDWAEYPVGVDIPGTGGGRSSKHWATKAEEWAVETGAVPLAVHQVANAIRLMYAGLIGVPQPYPSNSVPEGWLVMDGSAFDVEANPLLVAKYPTGVLPDLRKMFIRGVGDGRVPLSFEANANKAHSHTVTVSEGGAHGHTGSADSAGGHTHPVTDPGHTHPFGASGFVTAAPGQGAGSYTQYSGNREVGTSTTGITIGSSGAHTHAVTINTGGAHTHTGSASTDGEEDSRPDNMAFLWACMSDAAIPTLPNIGAPD